LIFSKASVSYASSFLPSMIYVDTLEEKLLDANFEPISKSLVV